jgi:hypothetical protein
VDGEHLFDEGTSKMQETQGKGPLVVCAEWSACFFKELSKIRAQLENASGFATAGGADFEEDAVGEFPWAPEALRVGEEVAPSESPDGPALICDEGERQVAADGVAEPFKFSVDAVLAQGGFKGEGINENVDVLRKSLDQIPALRQAGAALEDDLVGSRGGDDSQGFGDIVVLLDD